MIKAKSSNGRMHIIIDTDDYKNDEIIESLYADAVCIMSQLAVEVSKEIFIQDTPQEIINDWISFTFKKGLETALKKVNNGGHRNKKGTNAEIKRKTEGK